jgi:hypothetical protein
MIMTSHHGGPPTVTIGPLLATPDFDDVETTIRTL